MRFYILKFKVMTFDNFTEGAVIRSGNFKLRKKIESLDEFVKVLESERSIFARHRMYPTAFFQSWTIRQVKQWLDRGWFWTADSVFKDTNIFNIN